MYSNNVIAFPKVNKQSNVFEVSDLGDYAHKLAVVTLSFMADEFEQWNIEEEKAPAIIMSACALLLSDCIETFLKARDDPLSNITKDLRTSIYEMFVEHLNCVKEKMNNE